MKHDANIDESTRRRAAVEASCDVRTINKVIRGEPVRGMAGERARVRPGLPRRGGSHGAALAVHSEGDLTRTRLIQVKDRARSAWPFLPNEAPADTWWLGPLGERVRVNADGSADEVGQIPRRSGAASDPCNS